MGERERWRLRCRWSDRFEQQRKSTRKGLDVYAVDYFPVVLRVQGEKVEGRETEASTLGLEIARHSALKLQSIIIAWLKSTKNQEARVK